MLTVSDGFVILVVLTIHSKYVFSIDNIDVKGNPQDHSIKSPSGNINDANKDGNVKPPDIQKSETKVGNRISEYSLEGGGVTKQISTALINNVHVESEGESHSKGSKGRKGVAHQGSSIVPRKGVDNSEALSVDNDHLGSISALESSSTTVGKIVSGLNATEVKQYATNQTTQFEEVTQQIIQAKKPEVVSDLGDADDFETYTIIKTSTTGEDYVIIGIVIVIGIWFSVFGALIFYRRAGEYWDRRHYRRMDFLVEGMYND